MSSPASRSSSIHRFRGNPLSPLLKCRDDSIPNVGEKGPARLGRRPFHFRLTLTDSELLSSRAPRTTSFRNSHETRHRPDYPLMKLLFSAKKARYTVQYGVRCPPRTTVKANPGMEKPTSPIMGAFGRASRPWGSQGSSFWKRGSLRASCEQVASSDQRSCRSISPSLQSPCMVDQAGQGKEDTGNDEQLRKAFPVCALDCERTSRSRHEAELSTDHRNLTFPHSRSDRALAGSKCSSCTLGASSAVPRRH
jgi:hypothetical protein